MKILLTATYHITIEASCEEEAVDRYLDDPGAWGAVATRTITTEVVENDDSE